MKAFYIAPPSLGDAIINTPAARHLKTLGYDIIWINTHPAYACAFETIPWISGFRLVELCPWLDRKNANESLSQLFDEFQQGDVFVWGRQDLFDLFLTHPLKSEKHIVMSPRCRFSDQPSITYPVDIHWQGRLENSICTERLLKHLGFENVNDIDCEVGFRKIDMHLPKGTIVINIGSGRTKRIHPLAVVHLSRLLERHNLHVKVICYPHIINDIEFKCAWPKKASNTATVEVLRIHNIEVIETTVTNLLQNLNLIEQSDCLITPDGGLLHVAAALKHPMVYLETYYPASRLFLPYKDVAVIRPEQRYDACSGGCELNGPLHECCRCPMNDFSVGCLTAFNYQTVVDAVLKLTRKM